MHRFAILAAILALVVAGCGAQEASPTATLEPTPTEVPTPDPTEEPDPTEAAEESADDGGGDTPLADLLPDELNGLPRTEIPGMEAMISSMLQGQGLDADDADFAFASYGEGESAVVVNAFRIPGVDAEALAQLAALMSGAQQEPGVEAESVEVAGKSVLRMSDTAEAGVVYLYFEGGAAFTVVSQDEAAAEQLLAELP